MEKLWRMLHPVSAPSPQAEMMSVVDSFREERYATINQEVVTARAQNLIIEHLRSKVDKLQSYKAEADRRMMAAGIELPPDP